MQLLLLRHAHAVTATENPARPLSARGRRQVRDLAAFLKSNGAVTCAEVWHSPLDRSRETASLLVKGLHLRARLVEIPGIKGEDRPSLVAARVQRRRTNVAIVGHEPHLSALASFLVTGAAHPSRFELKKCAALALVREAGLWRVRWQVSPEIVR